MIEVEQLRDDDCFRACAASILELPIVDVPHYEPPDWWIRWIEWMEARNLTMFSFKGHEVPRGYSIMSAPSPRGDFMHAVVAFNGQMVWDPHPQREMGVGEAEEWIVFGVLDPARWVWLIDRPLNEPIDHRVRMPSPVRVCTDGRSCRFIVGVCRNCGQSR